jgi:deoxyribonuclease V
MTLKVRPGLTHQWRVSRQEAAAIQERLAREVVLSPLSVDGPGSPRLAAGVDVAYAKDGSWAFAAAVVMDRRWDVVATAVAEGEPDGAYATGYLAFREGRLTVEALTALEMKPALVFLDGHGVVHERGFGLASHVGVMLGVPTIGIPKTPFHSIDHDPGPERGDYYVLTKDWGAQGASIRLKARSNPVYVSPGHLVDLPSAITLAMAWSTGRHRVPEPLSAAHTLSLLSRNGGVRATPPGFRRRGGPAPGRTSPPSV